LPALFDRVKGIVYFGRMLDKIRLAAVVGYRVKSYWQQMDSE